MANAFPAWHIALRGFFYAAFYFFFPAHSLYHEYRRYHAVEQELRYARLLEIPVESCTVITKKSKKRTHVAEERLKNKAIEEVNRQAEAVEKQEPESADVSRQELPPSPTEIAVVSAVASEGETRVETAPEREEVNPTPPLLEGKREIETRVPEIPLRFAPVLESAEGALEEEFLATSDTAGEDFNLDSALPVCEIIEELPVKNVALVLP